MGYEASKLFHATPTPSSNLTLILRKILSQRLNYIVPKEGIISPIDLFKAYRLEIVVTCSKTNYRTTNNSSH